MGTSRRPGPSSLLPALVDGGRRPGRLAVSVAQPRTPPAIPAHLVREGWQCRSTLPRDRSAADRPQTDLDAASRAWVAGLQSSGRSHEDCVTALHAVLLRVARHEVARRAGSLQLRGPELEDVAQQATDDALMAIRAKVAGFRGDSRFTTWAYRFVMFEVSTKMGRHFWRERRASLDDEGWERLPDASRPARMRRASTGSSSRRCGGPIDEDLTALQRRVFVAIALNEVPMDAFARELGASRNAVYKALFDARRSFGRAWPRPVTSRPTSRRGRCEPRSGPRRRCSVAESVDAGCAAGFEVLHRYVEEELAGGDPAPRIRVWPLTWCSCPACRQDYLGLIEAAQTVRRRRPDAPDPSRCLRRSPCGSGSTRSPSRRHAPTTSSTTSATRAASSTTARASVASGCSWTGPAAGRWTCPTGTPSRRRGTAETTSERRARRWRRGSRSNVYELCIDAV